MMNSNFLSKKHFHDNIEGLNLWLQQNFGIAFKNSELEQQKIFYSKYISFINYRQKYILDKKPNNTILISKSQEESILLLLRNTNISLLK